MEELTKVEKRSERLKKMVELHGWKLNVPASCLSKEDKANLGGGLRCFGKVYERDKFGNKQKDLPKRRCGNPAVKGSFYCKKCGGGNSHALVHGRSVTASLYRGAFNNQLGNLFDAFLSDPSVLDLVPELTALRVAYRDFLEKATSGKTKIPAKQLIKTIRKISRDEMLGDEDKFTYIKDICSRELALSDPDSINLMRNIMGTIGETVERIYKIQTKEDFQLTADGIKILLRCIVDILKRHVDGETLSKVKEELLEISIRTKGDLRKVVDEKKQLTMDARIVDEKAIIKEAETNESEA